MNQYFRDIIKPEKKNEKIPVLFIIRQGWRIVKEEIRELALNYFRNSPIGYEVMIYNEKQSQPELFEMAHRAKIIWGGHGAGTVESQNESLIIL